MRISELIKRLENIREEHGDLPVYRLNDDYEYGIKAIPLENVYNEESIEVHLVKKGGEIVIIGKGNDDIECHCLDMYEDVMREERS